LIGENLRKQLQKLEFFMSNPPSHVVHSLNHFDSKIKTVTPQLVCATLKKSGKNCKKKKSTNTNTNTNINTTSNNVSIFFV